LSRQKYVSYCQKPDYGTGLIKNYVDYKEFKILEESHEYLLVKCGNSGLELSFHKASLHQAGMSLNSVRVITS